MKNKNIEFPSPLEVWVVSYETIKINITDDRIVSVPSRGMGGFLLSGSNGAEKQTGKFPSPLEVWVVSYTRKYQRSCCSRNSFRPLSRYGWFPTIK